MKTKKKVLKLKRSWCFVLGVLACVVITLIAKGIYTSLEEDARKCDQKLGHVCSIYELKNYKNN